MITLRPLRSYLKANTSQPLPVAMVFSPQKYAHLKANMNASFVIDVSGSMHEMFQGRRKIDVVIEALNAIFSSNLFSDDDYISLIAFDHNAYNLILNRKFVDTKDIMSVTRRLADYGGGTRMGLGMREALSAAYSIPEGYTRKVFIFTDGQTHNDEEECVELAAEYSRNRIAAECFGLGEEYNEDLLGRIYEITKGYMEHLKDISEFRKKFEERINLSTREVILNVALEVKTFKDIKVSSVNRVFPSVFEVQQVSGVYQLGSVDVVDGAVYLIQLDAPPRPANTKVMLCEIKVTYDVPKAGVFNEEFKGSVIVHFTDDAGLYNQTDQQVLFYLQQLNISLTVNKTVQLAKTDPVGAAKTLHVLYEQTQKLGNVQLAKTIKLAEEQLTKTKTIDQNLLKTIKIESKTKTMKM